MRRITFCVERSRNVDVSCKTVLRLRDLHLRSVPPLRTNLYSSNPFAAWKGSVTDQVGEASS
jgi:hypothetical protein